MCDFISLLSNVKTIISWFLICSYVHEQLHKYDKISLILNCHWELSVKEQLRYLGTISIFKTLILTIDRIEAQISSFIWTKFFNKVFFRDLDIHLANVWSDVAFQSSNVEMEQDYGQYEYLNMYLSGLIVELICCIDNSRHSKIYLVDSLTTSPSLKIIHI